MRSLVLALAMVLPFAPALAADASVATRGAVLRDANQLRVGRVEDVRSDGSVGLIINSRFVVVPARTLSIVDGKLTTSLSKKDVAAIH